jgi:alkylation response protein AidB-like acyl-CoA dehydrogenase
LDLARRLADVAFEDVDVEDSALVHRGQHAKVMVERQLQVALVLQSSESVGVADRLFEMTMQYAKDRYAFGRPIGSFQAIKHMAADLLVLLEASRALTASAIASVAREADDAAATVSVAKAYIGPAVSRLARACLQIHGGIGFTWEHDLHLYLRRAKSNEALFGDRVWHLDRYHALDSRRSAGRSSLPAVSRPQRPEPDNSEEAAFRRRAREWLDANLPIEDDPRPPGDPERVGAARGFQSRLHAAGLAGLSWPKAYGGQGLSARMQRIFDEEVGDRVLPNAVFGPTFHIMAQTLLTFASEVQKLRYLPAMLDGREIWAQLLSEPGAGSDLAGVQTRALRDGDGFLLTGAKVWTTYGHVADRAVCLARTDPDVPKHDGLTMFIVDMRAPGMQVRPLRQITGETEFNEEFLDEVRVDTEAVIGEIGDGWRVARQHLVFERSMEGGRRSDDDLIPRLAGEQVPANQPGTGRLVAEAAVLDRTLYCLVSNITARLRDGSMPGPATSLLKLMSSEIQQRKAGIALEIAGPAGVAWVDRTGDVPSRRFLATGVISIGGGTDQIQRNIIAEQLIGLPKEPAVDRNIPFSQVVRSRHTDA